MIGTCSATGKITNSRRMGGFALPTVLIASIIMLSVLLVSVASTAAIRVNLMSQTYNQLAKNAGDAGAAYAKACLDSYGGVPQWTDDKPLTPSTDCSGNQLAGFTCPAGSVDVRCSVTVNGGTVQVLVVGGGGGGGSSSPSGGGGGGGGAGGLIYNSSYSITAQPYPITVGSVGAPGGTGLTQSGSIGGNSSFGSIIATGGGIGGAQYANGGGGGSGGGGGFNGYSSARTGGNQVAGQGSAGGSTILLSWAGGAGGGGAGGAGGINKINHVGGDAGLGLSYSISGSPVTYSAGGGGGSNNPSTSPNNTGKGGDAAYAQGTAYAGGSGIVIISYPTGSITATITGGTTITSGGNTIHKFTGSGSFNVTAVSGVTLSTFSVGLPSLINGKASKVNSIGSTKLLNSTNNSVWRQYKQTSLYVTSNSTPPVVNVYAWGGGGAGGTVGGWIYGAAGGSGGAAQGVLTEPVGKYSIVVGGGGGVNSYNGGLINCAVGGGGCASWNNSDNRYGSGGGGYSGVFTSSITQDKAVLIAGGGGGGGSSRAGTGNAGGAGGGSIGQDGFSPYDSKTAYAGKGGTQSAAGADANSDAINTTGGQGALQGGRSKVNSYGGAGGGGYWGGSGGGYSESNTMGGGGGGSSYYNSLFIASPLLLAGSGTTPGNSSSSLRGTAGNSGAVASAGSSGVVVITYPTGSMTATGGTITISGGNTIHTFTSSGNFEVNAIVKVLAVGGGGGGGSDMGGGGGGGGVVYNSSISLTSQPYTVNVGQGGVGGPAGQGQVRGVNGQNSAFSTITAIGGGGGASNHDGSTNPAGNGGSGGGASGGAQPPSGGSGGSGGYGGGAAGIGTSGQGYAGSFGIWAWYPGGGGGAGGVGSTNPARGGIGVANSILGTSYYWGGGGGGAGYSGAGGSGGNGGGGGGAVGVTVGGSGLNAGSSGTDGCTGCWANVPGGNAGANTGGGGGGGSHYNATNKGGDGGSGIVIISYPTGSVTANGGTVTTSGGNTIHTFKSSSMFIVGAGQRTSCKAILDAGESTGNGSYWIYPTSSTGYLVYCDMTTNGGGWVLAMQITDAQDTTFGYQSNYWTTANVLNNTAPNSLSSTNAKYETFNTFVTTDGNLMLKAKNNSNYSTLSVPSMAGNTLLNRFTNLGGGVSSNNPGATLTVISGSQSPQELMGYAAPTAMCVTNPAKWRINFQDSHAGARLGNDVGTNDQTTNNASSWPCYNGEGSNLSYSGVGGTLESGDQWQDSYGSESLNRYRSNGGTGQGSHRGVSIFVR